MCRQRWTVRLGEVEPVFGQTGRVVLDITARTAHDGALKWTRAPSTPRAARSIFATFPSTCALPSGGRWSLRRVLQRPGRQRKRSSAKSSCGPSRTSSSAPSSPPCCNARCAPPRLATRRAPSCATLPRRMRSDGLETVNVRTSRGTTVPVTTPYYREKHARRAKRRPGLYPALVVLGIYDRCTPKLASDASRAVAMLSSLAEAQAQLRSDGIALDIKTLRSTAYRYAARARAAQQSAACGLLDRVTGKRVVVSLDGGRVRVRRKKRGPKTKKGRNRFHTDWKEPKLLILYVVGDDGRPSQTWAPIIDGTLRGPEAVFALLLSYARQIGLNAADKVLFIADGAPWIWRRLQRLIAALGLSPTQVLGLIDFYHAAKQLSDAVQAAPLERDATHPLAQPHAGAAQASTRGRGDHGPAGAVPRAHGRQDPHAPQLLPEEPSSVSPTPQWSGSGFRGAAVPSKAPSVASSISASRAHPSIGYRRASTRFLLLRSFYKSGRWNCLQADGHDAGGCERVTRKSGMRPGRPNLGHDVVRRPYRARSRSLSSSRTCFSSSVWTSCTRGTSIEQPAPATRSSSRYSPHAKTTSVGRVSRSLRRSKCSRRCGTLAKLLGSRLGSVLRFSGVNTHCSGFRLCVLVLKDRRQARRRKPRGSTCFPPSVGTPVGD